MTRIACRHFGPSPFSACWQPAAATSAPLVCVCVCGWVGVRVGVCLYVCLCVYVRVRVCRARAPGRSSSSSPRRWPSCTPTTSACPPQILTETEIRTNPHKHPQQSTHSILHRPLAFVHAYYFGMSLPVARKQNLRQNRAQIQVLFEDQFNIFREGSPSAGMFLSIAIIAYLNGVVLLPVLLRSVGLRFMICGLRSLIHALHSPVYG